MTSAFDVRLQWLHLVAVAALAWWIWLVPDRPLDWRWWCVVIAAASCAIGIACRAPLGTASPLPWRRMLIAVAPYAWYALILLASYWVHQSPAGWQAITDQSVFLVVIAGVAQVRRAPLVLAFLLAILSLIGLQVLGPVSVIGGIGRALHYKSIDQWGGYPEIGMLVTLAACACLALAFAARRITLGLAAAVLAAGFASTTAYMLSRSAVLTILVMVPWLALVSAIRFRARVAMVTLALVAFAGLVVVARAGPEGWARVAAAAKMSGGELDVRADGWRTAWAMLKDHPWLGIGPGRYQAEHARYSKLADSAHAYNILLHVGAELGVTGLIAYTAIWGRLLVNTIRAAGRDAAGLTAFALHGMLFAFLVRSLSEHFLANLPASFRMLLALGFVLGLAEAASRRADSTTESHASDGRRLWYRSMFRPWRAVGPRVGASDG